jgi:hypothetical protein
MPAVSSTANAREVVIIKSHRHWDRGHHYGWYRHHHDWDRGYHYGWRHHREGAVVLR